MHTHIKHIHTYYIECKRCIHEQIHQFFGKNIHLSVDGGLIKLILQQSKLKTMFRMFTSCPADACPIPMGTSCPADICYIPMVTSRPVDVCHIPMVTSRPVDVCHIPIVTSRPVDAYHASLALDLL